MYAEHNSNKDRRILLEVRPQLVLLAATVDDLTWYGLLLPLTMMHACLFVGELTPFSEPPQCRRYHPAPSRKMTAIRGISLGNN